MAKQTVNIGTSANDRTGDSLRSAFNKINENFTELYTSLGLDEAPLNLGAFEFTGSTLTTTDSSAITIAQNLTVTNDITVGGDIVPNVTEEHNLGSSTLRFKDLYLSGSTIDLGGTTLSVTGGELQLGGIKIPTQTEVDSAVASASPTGDLKGSVFADDSTILVDGVAGKIRGDIESDTVNITSTVADVNITAADDIDLETTGANADIRLTSSDNIRLFSVSDTSIDSNTYVGIFTDASNSLHNFIFSETGYFEVLAETGGININNELNFNSGGSPTATMKLNSTILEVENTGGFRLKDSGGNTQMEYLNESTGVLNVAGTISGTLNGDVTGSVFADDSTLLVDGVDSKVVGNFINNTINVEEEFDLIINTSGTQEDTSPVGVYSNTFKFTAQGELIFDSSFGEIKAADGAILNIQYLAESETHWASAPETVKEALDRIAAAIYAVNGNNPI